MQRLLGLFWAVLAAGCGDGSTAVHVVNRSGAPAEGLAVHVTGRVYPLPALDPGASASAHVTPTGESAIYIVDRVRSDTLGACCYIERGYGGAVRFEVRGDTARVVTRWSRGPRLGP